MAMTNDEVIRVIRAATDYTEPVQRRRRTDNCASHRTLSMEWTDVPDTHGPASWNFEEFDYRLKPKPRDLWLVIHKDQRDSPDIHRMIATIYSEPNRTDPRSEYCELHFREVVDE